MTCLNLVQIPPIPAPTADPQRAREDATIRRAMSILSKRMKKPGHLFNSPRTTRDWMRLSAGQLDHEVFTVLYLDCKHCLIASEDLFRGTLHHTAVYPREVVKAVLGHNAHAVIFAHNHPSGTVEPSDADRLITRKLCEALDLIGVRVLDHVVVTASESYSFAEHGEL